MPKDAYFFPHDYYARLDPKLARLRMERGLAGIGLYWCIVEKLYEADGYLKDTDIPVIAHELDVKPQTIESLVGDHFGLLRSTDGQVTSDSVLKRLEIRKVKIEKARESANSRWGRDANAMRTQCERNAIKERKVKESRVNIPPIVPQGTVVKTAQLKKTEIPDWIKTESWAAFCEMRLKLRAPLTERAKALVISRLSSLRADGDDADEVLNQSTRNGWKSIWPLKGGGDGRSDTGPRTPRALATRYTRPEDLT